MLHVCGCPVRPDDALWLIDELDADAQPAALSAALVITNGVQRGLSAVTLTREECTAVLGALADPPDGLAELRGQLLREHADDN